MKKAILAILMMVAITSFTIYGLTNTVTSTSAAQTTEVTTDHDLKQLENIHIKLDVPLKVAAIAENDAIEKAKAAFPGWAQDATSVKVEYHLVSNNDFELFSDAAKEKNPEIKANKHLVKTPAYLVSFRGMSYAGHTPANFSGKTPIHHEYNVVVDAVSGEPLYGFSYR